MLPKPMCKVYAIPFKTKHILIPVRVQVSMARQYCEKNNLDFNFPAIESLTGKNYSQLDLLMKQNTSKIIIYSHVMLAEPKALSILISNYDKESGNRKIFCATYSGRVFTLEQLIEELTWIDLQNRYCYDLGKFLQS